MTDTCEVVDKILYRGNRYVTLSLAGYANENAAFRTADDKMLSDHYPASAALDGGVSFTHGGAGGTAQSLTLNAGEHLSSATISTGSKDGRTRSCRTRYSGCSADELAAGARMAAG